jgi:hypothetical protein
MLPRRLAAAGCGGNKGRPRSLGSLGLARALQGEADGARENSAAASDCTVRRVMFLGVAASKRALTFGGSIAGPPNE